MLEIFVCLCFWFSVACLGAWALFNGVISVYCKYVLSKDCRRLQWRCVEYDFSYRKRSNGEQDYHDCRLDYRILPSDISSFVRFFGNNKWNIDFKTIKVWGEDDFLKAIESYKTVGDVNAYYEELEMLRDKALYMHP